MPDEPVAEIDPVGFGDELHQVLFDGHGVGGAAQGEAVGETLDVGIDNDAGGYLEGAAKNDIGGLATDAVEGDEGFEVLWDFALMEVEELAAAGLDVAGLVAEQTDAPDVIGKLFDGCLGVVGGGAVLPEKAGGDDVDLSVGALGGKDGGDEEFEGIGEVEFAMGIGVGDAEGIDDAQGTFASGGDGFAGHSHWLLRERKEDKRGGSG